MLKREYSLMKITFFNQKNGTTSCVRISKDSHLVSSAWIFTHQILI